MAHPKRHKQNNIVTNEINPFGVYRPVTQESFEQLWPAADRAVQRANEFLLDSQPYSAPLLETNEMFGLTFVAKNQVAKDMRSGAMPPFIGRKAVKLWKQDEALANTADLSVSLAEFAALNAGAMGYFLEENEEFGALKVQSDAVESWMGQVGAEASRQSTTRTPSHLTLARKQFVRVKRKEDIPQILPEERDQIGAIFNEEILAIGSVAVEPLLIGRGYDQELPVFEKEMSKLD